MKIKKVIHKDENYILSTFECEQCQSEFVGSGINRNDFFNIVLPNLKCPDCRLNSFKETEESMIKKFGKSLTLRLEQIFAYCEEFLRPKCCECDHVGIRVARNGKKFCSQHYGEFVLNTYQE